MLHMAGFLHKSKMVPTDARWINQDNFWFSARARTCGTEVIYSKDDGAWRFIFPEWGREFRAGRLNAVSITRVYDIGAIEAERRTLEAQRLGLYPYKEDELDELRMTDVWVSLSDKTLDLTDPISY